MRRILALVLTPDVASPPGRSARRRSRCRGGDSGRRCQPADVQVDAGTPVTWRNADASRHRVRSTSGPEELDSGNLEPGQAFSR